MKISLPKTSILVALLFLQVGLLYGVLYWGYHSSRLPYWFDNYVHKTGIWKIFGVKTYIAGTTGDYFFDPRLDYVQTGYVNKYEGFMTSYNATDDTVSIEVGILDGPFTALTIPKSVLKKVCWKTQDVSKKCNEVGTEFDSSQNYYSEIYEVKTDIEGESVYYIFFTKNETKE